MRTETPLDPLLDHLFGAHALGADHLDQLATSRGQLGKTLRGLVRQGPHFVANRCGKAGDDLRIQPIGLGEPSHRAGKIADLTRVDHHDRQSGASERGGNHLFEPTGRFQHDQARRDRTQPVRQFIEPNRVARNPEGLVGGMNMHVNMRLGDINADKNALRRDRLHGDPSLQMRDRSASQATVRVHRQSSGRGPSLNRGLGVPGDSRGPVHTRPIQFSKRTDKW